MESYSPLCERKWGVTDKFVAVNYSKNAGAALDADLALMLRHGAPRLASVLKRGAHKLALKLKREASQACICVETRSYTSSCFNIETQP